MSRVVRTALPEVSGLLTGAEVAETAAAIASLQQPDGGIPWAVGEHIDPWNHVEAAMALGVGGEHEAAVRAFEWVGSVQRDDGSTPAKTVGTDVVDPTADTNMTGYVAVGVWHRWLLTDDRAFVDRWWPAVKAALNFVVAQQLDWGGITWSIRPDGVANEGALVAGSSSLHQSLRAGLALAALVGEPQPHWTTSLARLRHALENHLDLFLDKSTFSMDWYYPILAGPWRGDAAQSRLAHRWDDFVVAGLGVHCVDTNPWVTGAETCELVLALDAVADERASQVFADMLHSRHESGLYWTGFVYGDDVFWPGEQTTYTSAAVILAADALSQTTKAAGIFRGDSLPDVAGIEGECGC